MTRRQRPATFDQWRAATARAMEIRRRELKAPALSLEHVLLDLATAVVEWARAEPVGGARLEAAQDHLRAVAAAAVVTELVPDPDDPGGVQ